MIRYLILATLLITSAAYLDHERKAELAKERYQKYQYFRSVAAKQGLSGH